MTWVAGSTPTHPPQRHSLVRVTTISSAPKTASTTRRKPRNKISRARCVGCGAAISCSPVTRADLIVVLDQGRIQEVGDHDSRFRRGGAYAAMFQRQFQDVEPPPESRRERSRPRGSLV